MKLTVEREPPKPPQIKKVMIELDYNDLLQIMNGGTYYDPLPKIFKDIAAQVTGIFFGGEPK